MLKRLNNWLYFRISDFVAFLMRLYYRAHFHRYVYCDNVPEAIRVYAVKRLKPSWAAAQTMGRNIFALSHYKDDPVTLSHEIMHVRQGVRYGIAFPFIYLYGYITKGYRHDPMEEEAYAEGSEWYRDHDICH